jgi:hypothetical protein
MTISSFNWSCKFKGGKGWRGKPMKVGSEKRKVVDEEKSSERVD